MKLKKVIHVDSGNSSLFLVLILIIVFSCKRVWDNPNDPYGDNYQGNSNNNIQYGSLSDGEGNSYITVKIGSQTWMAENLKATKYRDGTSIPNVTDNSAWLNLTTGAYCWYDNNASNKATYGALYNWYAVSTGKLCPTGWHVPTDAEWTTLSTFLGGESVAGGKMKTTTGWNSPNEGATNSSGFSALPGGFRGRDGSFGIIGSSGYWWSSSEYSASYAWSWELYNFISNVYRFYFNYKSTGFSVRCVRD